MRISTHKCISKPEIISPIKLYSVLLSVLLHWFPDKPMKSKLFRLMRKDITESIDNTILMYYLSFYLSQQQPRLYEPRKLSSFLSFLYLLNWVKWSLWGTSRVGFCCVSVALWKPALLAMRNYGGFTELTSTVSAAVCNAPLTCYLVKHICSVHGIRSLSFPFNVVVSSTSFSLFIDRSSTILSIFFFLLSDNPFTQGVVTWVNKQHATRQQSP